jgi:hypothetical protein
MEWNAYIDAYCERTDPGYWAEPVNALTNLAFLVAAAVMWRRTSGMPLARALCVVLGLIGVSSYLWHTHARAWSVAADSGSIAVFILLYLYAANRAFFGWPVWLALLGTAGFFLWSAALTPVFAAMPFFRISDFYWPVAALIALYAVLLRRRAPATARGLAIGAGILALSLTFRSLDEALCPSVPVGVHFMWHLLNAVMLGWMIEVWRRHERAGGTPAPA